LGVALELLEQPNTHENKNTHKKERKAASATCLVLDTHKQREKKERDVAVALASKKFAA
jgi:hypothetical protein